MNKEFMRFLIVGGANTLITYAIYLLFLPIFNYNIAYGTSYVSGIVISFILNAKFVFNTNLTFGKAIKYPLVYVVQYIINVILLNVFIESLNINDKLAPLIVIIISIPITFVLSKLILKK